MDPHFDPAKSKSSSIKHCNNQKCFFQQSYSEGSSWHAFKVTDAVYIGGEKLQDIPTANNLSIPFEFGCQDSETGLFRTQNVDGIMGLSASEETLPFQLFNKQIVPTKLFALCFRVGGGVFTLGGVDVSLHNHPKSSVVSYAKLLKKTGWYTVNLKDILLQNKKDSSLSSIGGALFKCNAGKGTIVDSGTTDTYLPQALFNNFVTKFKAITGLQYKTEAMTMSADQFEKMPSIIYRLESTVAGETIDVEVHPTSYFERHSVGKYIPRVYLTEQTGTVLGANFMNNHNIIFDVDNLRIGFAKSLCRYSSNSTWSQDFTTNPAGKASDFETTKHLPVKVDNINGSVFNGIVNTVMKNRSTVHYSPEQPRPQGKLSNSPGLTLIYDYHSLGVFVFIITDYISWSDVTMHFTVWLFVTIILLVALLFVRYTVSSSVGGSSSTTSAKIRQLFKRPRLAM